MYIRTSLFVSFETTTLVCWPRMQQRPHGDNMETTWGQHEDNMGTTGKWRPHGDNMETMWGPQGCGDHMGTTWRQHGDKMRIMWIIQFCLKICDLLRHLNLCVDVWVVGWICGLMDGSMGGTRSNH